MGALQRPSFRQVAGAGRASSLDAEASWANRGTVTSQRTTREIMLDRISDGLTDLVFEYLSAGHAAGLTFLWSIT